MTVLFLAALIALILKYLSPHSTANVNRSFFYIVFMRLWTEGWGSLHAVSSTSVCSSEGTQSGRKMDPEVIWTLDREVVAMLVGGSHEEKMSPALI